MVVTCPPQMWARWSWSGVLPTGIAFLAAGFAAVAFPATASADATDDYPIPHQMIVTTCTAEQILAAARDFSPIYYQRYIIDKHNKSPEIQHAAVDSAHYFYSLSPLDRRAYSEQLVTNFADPMTASWPNWAKIFFNNTGLAAKETDNCTSAAAESAGGSRHSHRGHLAASTTRRWSSPQSETWRPQSVAHRWSPPQWPLMARHGRAVRLRTPRSTRIRRARASTRGHRKALFPTP